MALAASRYLKARNTNLFLPSSKWPSHKNSSVVITTWGETCQHSCWTGTSEFYTSPATYMLQTKAEQLPALCGSNTTDWPPNAALLLSSIPVRAGSCAGWGSRGLLPRGSCKADHISPAKWELCAVKCSEIASSGEGDRFVRFSPLTCKISVVQFRSAYESWSLKIELNEWLCSNNGLSSPRGQPHWWLKPQWGSF